MDALIGAPVEGDAVVLGVSQYAYLRVEDARRPDGHLDLQQVVPDHPGHEFELLPALDVLGIDVGQGFRRDVVPQGIGSLYSSLDYCLDQVGLQCLVADELDAASVPDQPGDAGGGIDEACRGEPVGGPVISDGLGQGWLVQSSR